MKKVLGNYQHFFPGYIHNLSGYNMLKSSNVNAKKMLVIPEDFFHFINQVNWMLVIWLIDNVWDNQKMKNCFIKNDPE